MNSNSTDVQLLEKKGITVEQIKKQLSNFKAGFPFINLDSPAVIGNGIHKIDEDTLVELNELYDSISSTLKLTKFVPASGAASRMFKEVFDFIDNPSLDHKIVPTLEQWNKFAFNTHIDLAVKSIDTNNLDSLVNIAKTIVLESGLNYGSLPKGLIEFHKYGTDSRTAFEEHLVEGALYSKGKHNTCRLHFTVSPEHQAKIQELIESKIKSYSTALQTTFEIEYSTQAPSTDTVAADSNNEPFRNVDGSLLFRPGGHGALIENLNQIDADIIFVKNIDNVVPDHLKPTTVEYKKACAAKLYKLQQDIYAILNDIDEGILNEHCLERVEEITGLELIEKSNDELKSILNRPIRVCGMVKNEGEPGGGPFWVEGLDGAKSLQIVESAQIDPNSLEQQNIVQGATHFNPVDLICSTKDYKGNKFELLNYVDPNTGFISLKSKAGKELKAMELPGLWNGAMANWITIFVEVPVITFNPVKTITDLLRETHQ